MIKYSLDHLQSRFAMLRLIWKRADWKATTEINLSRRKQESTYRNEIAIYFIGLITICENE